METLNNTRPLVGFKDIKLKEVAKPEPKKWDSEEALAIGNEILRQMGGVCLLKAMIGAHSFLIHSATYPGVSFKFKAGTVANYCVILLMPNDTYNIEIGKIRGFDYKAKFELKGAYHDMLRPFFSESTGLALSMPRVIGFNC